MSAMQYYTVEPPAQWQAGSTGAARTPLYFACADCDAKAPPIAGFISSDGTFAGLGILKIDGSAFRKPALFCVPCFARRVPPSLDPTL